MALPGNGTIPAVYAERARSWPRQCRHAYHGSGAGRGASQDIPDAGGIQKMHWPTDMALGCSSNSVLHLLAIANAGRMCL